MVTIHIRSLVWFVTGALLARAVTLMFVNAWRVDAAPGDTDSTLVQITPCRLVDTRQAGGTPLGPDETRTFAAHGTNGGCTIPADAVGLSMNVTADGATAPHSFLTSWNEDAPRPNTSSLNPAAGQTPTPNAVTTGLSGSGELNVYNFSGTVQVIIDINGYYIKTSLSELAARVTANETSIANLDDREPFAVTTVETANTQITPQPTEYMSVTVTAPVAGHVTVNSVALVNHDTDGGDVLCAIYDAIPFSIGGDDPSFQFWETGGLSENGSLSGTRRFDIAANETATYTLFCRENAPDGGAVTSGSLTAIFTPAP